MWSFSGPWLLECWGLQRRKRIFNSLLLHPIQLLASLHLRLYWLTIICGDICEDSGNAYPKARHGKSRDNEDTVLAEALPCPLLLFWEQEREWTWVLKGLDRGFFRFFSNSAYCTQIAPITGTLQNTEKQYSIWVFLTLSGARPDIRVLTQPRLSSPYPWPHPAGSEMTSQLLRTLASAEVFANYHPELSLAFSFPRPRPGRRRCVISEAQCLYQSVQNSSFGCKCFMEIGFLKGQERKSLTNIKFKKKNCLYLQAKLYGSPRTAPLTLLPTTQHNFLARESEELRKSEQLDHFPEAGFPMDHRAQGQYFCFGFSIIQASVLLLLSCTSIDTLMRTQRYKSKTWSSFSMLTYNALEWSFGLRYSATGATRK